MDFVLTEELKALSQPVEGPCVSIYLPTYRAGIDVQQNPIRLSNLLREAETQLVSLGMRSPEAKEFLDGAYRLQKDGFFWRQGSSDGLALFISSPLFKYYRLPLQLTEVVKVSRGFHLKPLLALFAGEGRFYVLALSQKQVRLVQCTRFACNEVSLEGVVPTSMDEALNYEYSEKQLQFHTGTQVSAGGRRAAMYHGQGGWIDDNKTNILRYFTQVNDGLRWILREGATPLVLAGVDYLLPIYREANTYSALFEQGVPGNPDELGIDELHKKAWTILEKHFQKAREDAVAKYHRFVGTGLASNDVREVVPACFFGRTEILFVPLGLQLWGSVDADSKDPELHEQEVTGDDDLLDLAAIQTFLNKGSVFTVDADEMPGNQPIAAVYRY